MIKRTRVYQEMKVKLINQLKMIFFKKNRLGAFYTINIMKRKRSIRKEGDKVTTANMLVTLFSGLFSLTEREQEVLTLIILDNGKTDKKALKAYIGKKLQISESNVAQQFTALIQKKALIKGPQYEINKYFQLPENVDEVVIDITLKIV